MKNYYFAALAVLLLCACTKETFIPAEGSAQGPEQTVAIRFVAEPDQQAPTKAFFDASTEVWEKTLNTLTVLVFNSTSGALLIQRDFTTSELTAKKAVFAIPNAAAGTTCDFYAVANLPVSGISTKTALLALLETSAGEYNGTFAEVTTKSKRTGGFVFSGSLNKALAAAGAQTDVALTLKRTVAKVALQVSLASDFTSKYKGAVRINSVKLSKAAAQSPVIKPATPTAGAMSYTFTQTPNSASNTFQALFYIFENGTLGVGSRVLLEMIATYDQDGNFSTTTDQAPMTYSVELEGKSGGAIERNGYYKVSAVLGGLIGSAVSTTITVADWETPLTQTINLGQ